MFPPRPRKLKSRASLGPGLDLAARASQAGLARGGLAHSVLHVAFWYLPAQGAGRGSVAARLGQEGLILKQRIEVADPTRGDAHLDWGTQGQPGLPGWQPGSPGQATPQKSAPVVEVGVAEEPGARTSGAATCPRCGIAPRDPLALAAEPGAHSPTVEVGKERLLKSGSLQRPATATSGRWPPTRHYSTVLCCTWP